MPSALPHRPLLVRGLARQRQHQPQRQLGGEMSVVPPVPQTCDTEFRRGVDIDGGIPQAGRDQETQIGQ